MSDKPRCFYNARKKVKSEGNYKLLCKWHVDCAWKKNLNLIPNRQQQCEVYAMLRLLLEEPDQKEFEDLLEDFKQKLKDENYDEFYNYFNTYYCGRTTKCASCSELKLSSILIYHWKHSIIFWSMCIWRQEKNQRLDVLLNTLFKILRDKTFKHLIQLEEGFNWNTAMLIIKLTISIVDIVQALK